MTYDSKFKTQHITTSEQPLVGQKGGATSMADLMKKQQAAFTSVKKGDSIAGTITKLTSHEILVSLGGKSEAKVIENDKRNVRFLLSTLKVGDKVTVQVLNPESEMGYPYVSLRRYIDEKTWGDVAILKNAGTPMDVTVEEVTKGGLVVTTKDGTQGFLPNSYMSHVANPQELVGTYIKAVIIDTNKEQNKVIFSQKAAGDENFTKAKNVLKSGEQVLGRITNVTPYGMFLSVIYQDDKEVDGFVHISEVSWDKTENLGDLYTNGQEIEAKVIGFDEQTKRVNLSIKQLSADPFTKETENLAVDQSVSASVKTTTDGAVSLTLLGNEQLEVLIPKEKVPAGVSYEPGQKLTVTISEIDTKRRRVLVSPVLLRKTIGYR